MRALKKPRENTGESEEESLKSRLRHLFGKSAEREEEKVLSVVRIIPGLQVNLTEQESNVRNKLRGLKENVRLPAMKMAAELCQWSPDAIKVLSGLDEDEFYKKLKKLHRETEKLTERKIDAPPYKIAFAIVRSGVVANDELFSNISKLKKEGVSDRAIANSIGKIPTDVLLDDVKNLKEKKIGVDYIANVALGLASMDIPRAGYGAFIQGIANFCKEGIPYSKALEIIPNLAGDKATRDYNERSLDFIKEIEIDAEKLSRETGMSIEEARPILLELTCKLGIDSTRRIMYAVKEVIHETYGTPARGSEADLTAARAILESCDYGENMGKALRAICRVYKPPEEAPARETAEESELLEMIIDKRERYQAGFSSEDRLIHRRLLDIDAENRTAVMRMAAELCELSPEEHDRIHEICSLSEPTEAGSKIKELYVNVKKLIDAGVDKKIVFSLDRESLKFITDYIDQAEKVGKDKARIIDNLTKLNAEGLNEDLSTRIACMDDELVEKTLSLLKNRKEYGIGLEMVNHIMWNVYEAGKDRMNFWLDRISVLGSLYESLGLDASEIIKTVRNEAQLKAFLKTRKEFDEQR